MEVILVKPDRKLGKVGETVSVANGYGRNYLIPQELAIRATKENVEKFASLKKDLEAKNDKNKVDAEKVAKTLEGKNLTFITQSASDGRLFGSVSAKGLAIELSKLTGTTLSYSNIKLDDPIKFNGVYNIQLVLHAEVITNILVIVAKSESEAQDALREYLEGDKEEDDESEIEAAALAAAAAAPTTDAASDAEGTDADSGHAGE
ncbi:MAG: 50S ribosomal protein L9 [Rickettsiales bacterium]|nr:MAG: 50S ribosomal protein L9 [Rickettsiales bacterium]